MIRKTGQWLKKNAQPKHPQSIPLSLKKIYILPTFFGLILQSVLMVILLVSISQDQAIVSSLAAIFSFMGLVGIVYTNRHLDRVRIESAFIAPHSPSEHALLFLTYCHPVYRDYALIITWEKQEYLLPITEAFHSITLKNMKTKTRGIYSFEKSQIATSQPLGIATAWSYFLPAIEEVVYPEPELNPPALPGSALDQPLLEVKVGHEDIQQLRDYRHGDSWKDVAWKASAKRERYVVKEYEQPEQSGWHVRWDSVKELSYEHALSRLAAWLWKAHEQGQDSSLETPDFKMPLGQGEIHLTKALKHLAGLPAKCPWERK